MADSYKLSSSGAEIDNILNTLKAGWWEKVGSYPQYDIGYRMMDHIIVGIGFDQNGQVDRLRYLGSPSQVVWTEYNDTLCLREGTKVLMADWTEKPIEEVKPGEMIKSYDLYNDKFIDVVTYGAVQTGTANKWQRMVFDNGKYLDIYEKHNVFSPLAGGAILNNTMWKPGEYGFAVDGESYITPKYAQTIELETPEREKRYRITCETSLYFVNGILTGSAPQEMYGFTQDGTIPNADEETIACLRTIRDMYDENLNGWKNNIDFVIESAPIYEARGVAVEKRKAAKEALAALDFKTVKYQQGKITEEEWVAVCEKCEELRKEVNAQGLECWKLNKALGKLKEKHGIVRKPSREMWRQSYAILMEAYYANKGETLDTSVLQTIKKFEELHA